MTTNQAFEFLSRFSDPHCARIICEHIPNMSLFTAYKIAIQLYCKTPVAKIIHEKWFYGLPFYTNRHTLDPRPDTETLIESVLSDAPRNVNILDIGTGTGCIIATLVKNIPESTGTGIDKSYSALHVAARNINTLKLNNYITLKHADFANPAAFNKKFDIIVSNPPYIKKTDKRINAAAKHDPKIALYAKHNGLYAYEQIAKNAKNWIKPNGKIYLEIGVGMLNKVKKIFLANHWVFIRVDKDLSNKQRVIVLTTNK
ncbi:MAG: peptide chain release factor N(5)-glutamine methyltransferase [Proteobacteria bacterium]|nr:peptide chain release factor N(5)-glutamine methyltransferase [Candidatus Enterousia scatequi]